MTEQEAVNKISDITQRILMIGVSPQNFQRLVLRIRSYAKGDIYKTLDGYIALEKRVIELIEEIE